MAVGEYRMTGIWLPTPRQESIKFRHHLPRVQNRLFQSRIQPLFLIPFRHSAAMNMWALVINTEKMDVLRSHFSLPIPTYMGAFIKPVSNANWYSLMSLRSVNLNLSLIMIPSIPVLSLIPPSKRSVLRSRLPIFIPHLA